jgi:ADP-ribosylglycohydrolase
VIGSRADQEDRAAGSLWGLAIGDALGMPTQLMSRTEVTERYGVIDGFLAPTADHPLAAGLAAATVTDDTEHAMLLGGILGRGGHLDQRAWARALLTWEAEARARGSLDLVGPSTAAAIAALQAGAPPEESGRNGVTNGAAMRICPVGIAVESADPVRLVDRVVEASLVTHNTSVALAGAAAVAAVVSRCIDGADLVEAVSFAVEAAAVASGRGRWVAGASVARRVEWATDRARDLTPSALQDFVVDLVGTSLATQESVPAAFALVAAYGDDPWRAVCTAAQLGGDADTIAAMTGAMLGAACGRSAFPDKAIRQVAEINKLDVDGVVRRLLEIRWA